ncbi:MAG TPA: hypothetical protein VKU83_12420 [Puia sp.]|nr:hypothetical protein [Puia sp.]
MTDNAEDPIVSLYRDAFPDFARMVGKMGGTLEQAKDNFHDALLIYLQKEKAGTLHLNNSPKAYVIGTAKICWLRAKKSGRTAALEGLEISDQENEAGNNAVERENRLLESLVKSGRKCLELLKAFYYDQVSMQDIAGRFGFSGGRSATVQKFKCLEKVRKEMTSSRRYAQ